MCGGVCTRSKLVGVHLHRVCTAVASILAVAASVLLLTAFASPMIERVGVAGYPNDAGIYIDLSNGAVSARVCNGSVPKACQPCETTSISAFEPLQPAAPTDSTPSSSSSRLPLLATSSDIDVARRFADALADSGNACPCGVDISWSACPFESSSSNNDAGRAVLGGCAPLETALAAARRYTLAAVTICIASPVVAWLIVCLVKRPAENSAAAPSILSPAAYRASLRDPRGFTFLGLVVPAVLFLAALICMALVMTSFQSAFECDDCCSGSGGRPSLAARGFRLVAVARVGPAAVIGGFAVELAFRVVVVVFMSYFQPDNTPETVARREQERVAAASDADTAAKDSASDRGRHANPTFDIGDASDWTPGSRSDAGTDAGHASSSSSTRGGDAVEMRRAGGGAPASVGGRPLWQSSRYHTAATSNPLPFLGASSFATSSI